MKILPVNAPLIGGKELRYAAAAIKSGWISSTGEFLDRFESGFARYTGRRYGVCVNNGTNALILALRALELPEGSEVIIPAFTIISCALACIYNNLVPVFVDADSDTWTIDVSKIEEKITKNTKAIMAVHIYGHPADMDKLSKICRKHRLHLVEDFAEAIGSEYKGAKCGNFGAISCASFYANKVISTGEGGVCLTNNSRLAARLREMRNLCFRQGERFVHYDLGFNFRFTNVQAGIGLAQLESIEARVKKKIWIGRTYEMLLGGLARQNIIKLPDEKEWAKSTFWAYGILLNDKRGITAKTAMNRLYRMGIETRPFFFPLHKQPALNRMPWHRRESLPVSENLYRYGFYLPSGLGLTEKQIIMVSKRIKNAVQ